MKNNSFKQAFALILILATVGNTAAQTILGEMQTGVTRFHNATLPTYSATLGVQHADFSIGLRYRHAASPIKESEVSHDISLLLQHSINITPQLELYGGVATGFAIQHSRLLYEKPFSNSNIPSLNAEVNLGLRYFVSENVALTFNVGAGCRISKDDWRSLTKQLPYDPRTIPTFVTASGGISIGFGPKRQKLNLPSQLIVEGKAPILVEYD